MTIQGLKTRDKINLTDDGEYWAGERDDTDQDSTYKHDGTIIVDQRKNEYGKEFFVVKLLDCRNRTKPLIPIRLAPLHLDVAEVFEYVQKCRSRWEKVFASATTITTKANGTSKIHFLFDERFEQPVDANLFKVLASDSRREVIRCNLYKLKRPSCGRRPSRFFSQREQTVSVSAPDFHIPWRMLYTHPNPNESLEKDGSNFSPNGFWGYQHIIEEFTTESYPVKGHVLGHKDQICFGAAIHDKIDADLKVDCVKRHREFVDKRNDLAYVEWKTKNEVLSGLCGVLEVVYFLCHAEGSGTMEKPCLRSPVLKLADGDIDGVEVKECTMKWAEGRGPFVFINACQGGHLGTALSHNFSFANKFIEGGAVCLIGPQIEVPAIFAGEFGKRFFERFMADETPPPTAGVILRDLTRAMWRERNPLGLVYSLYARGDCHIRWKKSAKQLQIWRLRVTVSKTLLCYASIRADDLLTQMMSVETKYL